MHLLCLLTKHIKHVIIIRAHSRQFIGSSYGKRMREETERMQRASLWDEVCIMHWNSHTFRVGQGTLCAEEREDEMSGVCDDGALCYCCYYTHIFNVWAHDDDDDGT